VHSRPYDLWRSREIVHSNEIFLLWMEKENEIMKTQWYCMCSALNIQNVHIIIPIIIDIIENPISESLI
jgi:hypothetical protein